MDYYLSSLISFRNAIERHLNNVPYNKSLKREGKENVQHKDTISVDDLKKLRAGPVLCLTNPWSLLSNVWLLLLKSRTKKQTINVHIMK